MLRQSNRNPYRFALVLLAGSCVPLPTSLAGDVIGWSSPTSGNVLDPSRWSGLVAPTADDTPWFGVASGTATFDVTFASDAAYNGVIVSNQRPIFRLNGYTFNATGDTTISGPKLSAPGIETFPTLQIDGGVFNARAGGGRAYVGTQLNEIGRLYATGGATVDGITTVGFDGSGELYLSNSTATYSTPGENLILGDRLPSAGGLVMESGSSLLIPNGSIYVGNSGYGAADLFGTNVAVTARSTIIAAAQNNHVGEVNLFGPGVTWTNTQGATVGQAGDGFLIVSGGAKFLSPSSGVAMGTGSTGIVQVDGPGSLVTGLNHVGWFGSGSLYIANGGVVSAWNSANNARNDGRVGEGNGTFSTVTIDGPGSTWKDLGATYIGGIYHSDLTGRGSITVQNGGRLEGTTFILGSGGPAVGDVFVTGAGSVMDAGFINVGSNKGTSTNQCSLTVSNGGTINTSGVVLYPKGLMAGTGVVTDMNPTDGSPSLYAISGTVSPGTTSAPIGTLTFNSPAQGVWLRAQASYPAPTLAIDLVGTGAGQFDRIATTGLAELGGNLAINRLNGYVPSLGSSFPIVSSVGIVGEFASISGSVLPNGRALVPNTGPTGLTLICSDYVGLSIAPSPINANLGFPTKITALGSFVPAGVVAINSLGPTWSSDNVGIATVDSTGLVIGQLAGSTTVRTQWNGRESLATVNVAPLPANLTTDLVSRSGASVIGNGYSFGAVLSADGSTAVFMSFASNLVPNDTNGAYDVFVRDLNTGTIELVGPALGGGVANGSVSSPTCSADGRLVAFSSVATNLVIGDTNGATDVFVFDRETGITERVSLATDGSQADGVSSSPMISRDGRRVVFQSLATNLVGHDTNAATDIFVHDRVTKVTERVSVAPNGDQANSLSLLPTFSPDGSLVLFRTSANNLFANDNNAVPDLVLKNISTGTVEPVTVASDGTLANSAGSSAYYHCISADNRFVCFQSFANNLVPGDTNNVGDIFLRDRVAGTTRRINVTQAGAQTFGGAGAGSITDDGRFAFYSSSAVDLVPGDTNTFTDIFRVDLRTGRVTRISDNHFGEQANSSSTQPMCSADGTIVGFRTDASNLGPFDNNANSDAAITRLTIPCDADFDGDGFLTFEDFDAFVAAFEAGQPTADFDGDGFLTFEDFDAFVAAFESGC